MVKFKQFIRKQPNSSSDYEAAFNIIGDIKAGETISYIPDNLPAFRKYACELAMKHDKQIATRMQKDGSLNISRLV